MIKGNMDRSSGPTSKESQSKTPNGCPGGSEKNS